MITYEVLQPIFATVTVFAQYFLHYSVCCLALQILANKFQLPEVGHLFLASLQKGLEIVQK